jgi:hypothetical protein
VLPSGFRFLDGDNPADPLIAREWRNVLPLCPRHRVRSEGFPQIRWNTVYRTRRDFFLAHEFHSTSPIPQPMLQAQASLVPMSSSVTLMLWMTSFNGSVLAVRCQANLFGNLSNQVSWLFLGRSQVIHSTN